MLQCLNGLRHVNLDVFAPHGEEIIFFEFSGSSMQIEGRKNTMFTSVANLASISSSSSVCSQLAKS